MTCSLKLATLAAALLLTVCPSPAFASAPNDLFCQVTDGQHNKITYSFLENGPIHLGGTMNETGYEKNNKNITFEVGHQPVWTIGSNDQGMSLFYQKDMSWELDIGTVTVTNGARFMKVALRHNQNIVGLGTCARAGPPPGTAQPQSPAPAPTPAPLAPRPSTPSPAGPVQLYDADGVESVDVVIGDNRWIDRMMLDTGSTLISLPESKVQTLVNSGDAAWTDQTRTFTRADGSTRDNRIAVIHKITIGGHSVTDVFVCADVEAAPHLLGNQALMAFGPYQIDQANHLLTFERR